MDPPVLHPLVAELASGERFRAFADALPVAARVSEPALPLLLAAVHEHLGRGLVCLLPDDADARDAAEAAGWFLGEERTALMPGRGVRWDSGLEPPPHLVGERARALDVLASGGLVCTSAAALAEGMPPLEARPQAVRLEVGAEQGLEAIAETLALAGYERVERAEERGQLAVRGGILDVFPATGREPLRVEFFGDEIEAIRAFSPFTQRTLRPIDTAVVYPAAERRLDLTETALPDGGDPHTEPADLVPPLPGSPDLVWQADEVRAVWQDEFGTGPPARRHGGARPAPARPGVRLRGAAPRRRCPRARRGGKRARIAGPAGPARRRHVPTHR